MCGMWKFADTAGTMLRVVSGDMRRPSIAIFILRQGERAVYLQKYGTKNGYSALHALCMHYQRRHQYVLCSASRSDHNPNPPQGAAAHTATVCNLPRRDHSRTLLSTTLSLYATTIVFVVVRIITRLNKRIKLSGGKDDVRIIAAFVIATPGAFLTPFWCWVLGKDVWNVPLDRINRYAIYMLVYELLYVISISLVKAAISKLPSCSGECLLS